MNAIGYIIRRIGWQLGRKVTKKRWQVAHKELQILKEAEDKLGKLAWRDIEEVEELTGEFWQLKNFEKQSAEIEKTLVKLEKVTGELEEKRFDILDKIDEEVAVFEKEKVEAASQADTKLNEIADIQSDAEEIRRRFEGLKVKYKVLREQQPDEEKLNRVQQELRDLKREYDSLKANAEERNQELEEIEDNIVSIDKKIADTRGETTTRTAQVAAEIGQNNKLVADYRAQLGSFERQSRELHGQIGIHLSANAHRPSYKKTARKHWSLVSKINYLRRSIQYNQRLAKGQ